MKNPALADAEWFKSSHSAGSGNDCVEVAYVPGVVGVRDSKDAEGANLAFGPAAWRSLLDRVKGGELAL